MSRKQNQPKGTLVVVPGPNASIGWRKHCTAPFVEAPIGLGCVRDGAWVTDDLNDTAAAFVRAAGQYMPETARIVFYEREPRSSNEAHAQNMLGKVLYTFGACCGLEIRAVSEINFSALLTCRETEAVTPHKVGLVAERDARNGNALCYCALTPRVNQRRTADYAELLTAIIERRLHWSEYGLLRQQAKNTPLWLQTLGADR